MRFKVKSRMEKGLMLKDPVEVLAAIDHACEGNDFVVNQAGMGMENTAMLFGANREYSPLSPQSLGVLHN